MRFAGNWAHKFAEEETKDGPFRTSAAEIAHVPMMHDREECAYLENADFQCVELPYQDALSMVIVLPRKPDGLIGE